MKQHPKVVHECGGNLPQHGRPDSGPIKHFGELKNDGSTSCGCWIYSGVFDGENKANGRDAHGKYGHGWGYAWPLDRRILYNRASAAPDGTPWSERKKLVWWDESSGDWTGDDVADFTKKKRPDAKGDNDKGGDEALPGLAFQDYCLGQHAVTQAVLRGRPLPLLGNGASGARSVGLRRLDTPDGSHLTRSMACDYCDSD